MIMEGIATVFFFSARLGTSPQSWTASSPLKKWDGWFRRSFPIGEGDLSVTRDVWNKPGSFGIKTWEDMLLESLLEVKVWLWFAGCRYGDDTWIGLSLLGIFKIHVSWFGKMRFLFRRWDMLVFMDCLTALHVHPWYIHRLSHHHVLGTCFVGACSN